MAGAFSSQASDIPPKPVLLGPTTFSTFTDMFNVGDRYGYDLVYLQHDVNPKLRRLGKVICKDNIFTVTSYIEMDHFSGEWPSPLPEYSAKSCSDTGPHELLIPELPTKNEFDVWDKKAIGHINRSYYKGIEKFGTLSFQHGHPTEKVYVFLPGLYMDGSQFLKQAEKEFWHGSNVIMGTLPGHQNGHFVANQNDIGSWLTYTDFLISIAHHYGKKVIVVGQSTGGTLAVRAAETGKVDELILFQPFFGLNKTMKAVMAFGELLPEFILNHIGLSLSGRSQKVLDILAIGLEDQNLLLGSFKKLPDTLPVDLVLATNDSVVSTEASLRWAKEYAPHAKITTHSWDHMFIINLWEFSPTN